MTNQLEIPRRALLKAVPPLVGGGLTTGVLLALENSYLGPEFASCRPPPALNSAYLDLLLKISKEDKSHLFLATGEEFKSRRAMATTHFLWFKGPSCLSDFFRDAQIIVALGGNHVSIPFNGGLIDNPEYINALHQAIFCAHKKLGLTISQTLHSNGIRTDGTPDQMTILGNNALDCWRRYLANPITARVVHDCVSMVNLLAEPVESERTLLNLGGKLDGATINRMNERFQNEVLRLHFGEEMPIILVNGAFWGSDMSVFKDGNLPHLDNYALEVHLYGTEKYWKELVKQKVPLIVGEIGYAGRTNPERLKVIRSDLVYCRDNHIPYCIWAINKMNYKGGDGQNAIDDQRNLNAMGEMFQEFNNLQ